MPVVHSIIKPPNDFSPIPDQILKNTIIWQFEQIVEKYPEHLAINSALHNLSYRELNNAINNLAHQITRELGEDRSPIAFLFKDEMFSLITFMAILKSGRPFVGIHPDNSNEQIKGFLEDSTASLFITTTEFKQALNNILDELSTNVLCFDEMQQNNSHQNPEHRVAPNDPYAIFYTSGSTGKPKGILMGHLYESQGIQDKINEWFISPSDRISLLTSVTHRAAYTNVLGALLTGASLYIFDLKENTAQKTLEWIINKDLTFFSSSPSIFRSVFGLASEDMFFSKLRLLTLGGEAATESDVDLFKAHTSKDCVLIHKFVSTEAGPISNYLVGHHTSTPEGTLPAGYPVSGKEIILLDDHGQLLNNGGEGEIVVKSRYLSLGYWRQPELTAQKFQGDPNDPELRMFYTGDRGRWRHDGVLEVLGRTDAMVKIRGFRVQLDMINQTLQNLDEVREATTSVHKTQGRGSRIVAYISMVDGTRISIGQLRKKLKEKLPEYMIPSIFIQMDKLPRSASGKIVRRELPEPTNDRPELEVEFEAPRSELQIQIAAIWSEILDLEKVGINDNFFELGGDSLLALQMTLEVEKSIKRMIPQTFFKNPTISYLDTLLQSKNLSSSDNGKFVIESYKKSARPVKDKKRKAFRAVKIKKVLSRVYSLERFDRLVDLLVARFIVSKPYPEALQWTVRWSRNTFVRNFLYRRRYALYIRWVESLKDCKVQPSNTFQLSLLANMNFGLHKYLGKREKSTKSNLQSYKKSPYPYWQTLGELLDETPAGGLNEFFPINGIEHFSQAHQKGKGVVLLSFHGVPTPGRLFPLERFMELDQIPTISYHIPIRQSEYHDNRDNMPEDVAATLNAEIALFAQRKLQEGKAINIVSDTNDNQGRTYKISVAGRIYKIKSGFAELAINTGAAIVPHFRYCLPDGRLQLNFGTPLDPGQGDREQQVEKLLGQYAAFIEQTWTAHPEAMRWIKIKKHLSRPAN